MTASTSDSVPTAEKDTRSTSLLSGVDALVRLLVLRTELDRRAGLRTGTLIAGYPGSPLGTVDLALEARAEELASHRIVHQPGLNEELAAAAVWGSQMGTVVDYDGLDGVVGAWYGKGPGLDRSGDALKHGNAMGSGPNGGVVVFCGDDPSSKSSTLPCDSQAAFEDACIPVLYPGDQQDLLDLGVHAFAMSRYSGAWVGVKIVTSVADGIGSVDLDPERHVITQPDHTGHDGRPWRHEPQRTIGPHAVPDQEALVVDRRLRAAKAYAYHHGLDRVVGAAPGARLGIVCAGKTYYNVVQAFLDLGVGLDDLDRVGVRILKLAMTFPLVEDTALSFAASVDELLVVEEKRPFVEGQLRAILHEGRSHVPLQGKRDSAGEPLSTMVGELDASAVRKILVRVLPDLAPPAPPPVRRTNLPLLSLPSRPPAFCSGCPHNRSTVVPDGVLVGGGVGCHGMMYFEARQQGMTALPPTPMGAEGVPWIGLSPFVSEPHLIQNLGDGTLSHSGTLAIRASVAAKVDVTYKILYNAAVAMTGGQEVAGLMEVPALTRALEAEGVSKIVVCAEQPKRYGRRARWAPGVEVHHRGKLEEVQARLREVPGTSVIIYDQQCAAEARRLRKRGEQETPPARVIINEAVCEGCGDCGVKSNCLSVLPIETEWGEKRAIHDPSCNRDYTCLEGDCPSFVTITPKKRRFGTSRRTAASKKDVVRPSLPPGSLPLPVTPVLDRQFGIYFTGIGGTGVVTANRVLANAAEHAGLLVGGMDQTGLSQKAGAVVSHLHLARNRDDLAAATVSSGGADLYLSGDILQAASAVHLDRVRPGHTIAVVDRELTPTAAMLQSDVTVPSVGELEASIADVVDGTALFVDSQHLAETVFGNHLLANIVLLGAAFQLGGLPFALEDVEAALSGRGKSAAANRAAFEWGRWVAHDPAAVAKAIAGVPADSEEPASFYEPSGSAQATARDLVAGRALPEALVPLLTRRAAQVVDYQGAARATRFLDLVGVAAARDSAEQAWQLTEAVAETWFMLLTYKDEYEVARLHLLADYDAAARDLGIEGDYKVKYHLHPPVFKRMGVDRKLPMGKPYAVAFRGLRAMKRFRGTALDVFGYDRDRRTERAVIEEYAELVTDSASWPYAAQVEIALSAQVIKGYGDIKERNVVKWHDQVAALTAAR